MEFLSDDLEFKRLLALLKAGMSISPVDNELFAGDVQWQSLFELAHKQGLIGLTFLGIQTLPEMLRPDVITIMRWFGYSNLIVGRNSVLNKKCSEIINEFAKDGYRSLIMKGQANARLYSEPNYRTPGDIDIWVDGDRKQIINYLKNKAHVRHIQFHHADFDILPDVEIEVHFRPTLLYNYFTNSKLQTIFLEEKEKSMSNHVELNDGSSINMLTPRANVLMQIVHMYRHFLFAGVGLRQIADLYATLVHTSLTDETRIQLENDIKKIGLKKFSGALMWVLQKAFGMSSSFLIFSPNEKEGIYLWNEIVQSGNLGQHDTRYNTSRYSKIKGFFYITYQSFRVVSHYPEDWFWYLAYRTSQGFWKVINRYN